MKHGKKHIDGAKLVGRAKLYDLQEALELRIKTDTTKFDEIVEVHVKPDVDSYHADQQVRGAVVLPNGTNKQVRVLAICRGGNQKSAKEAGAEFVDAKGMAQKIQAGNWMDFDVLIITPDMMGLVSRFGKVLSPRGLMPNPKAGTIAPDVAKVVKEAKTGKIEYRLDRTNIIRYPIDKVSFGTEKLQKSFSVLFGAVIKAEPAASEGQYVRSCVVTPTMGPGVKVGPSKADGM